MKGNNRLVTTGEANKRGMTTITALDGEFHGRCPICTNILKRKTTVLKAVSVPFGRGQKAEYNGPGYVVRRGDLYGLPDRPGAVQDLYIWDGVSYVSEVFPFCKADCAVRFGIACYNEGIRPQAFKEAFDLLRSMPPPMRHGEKEFRASLFEKQTRSMEKARGRLAEVRTQEDRMLANTRSRIDAALQALGVNTTGRLFDVEPDEGDAEGQGEGQEGGERILEGRAEPPPPSGPSAKERYREALATYMRDHPMPIRVRPLGEAMGVPPKERFRLAEAIDYGVKKGMLRIIEDQPGTKHVLGRLVAPANWKEPKANGSRKPRAAAQPRA